MPNQGILMLNINNIHPTIRIITFFISINILMSTFISAAPSSLTGASTTMLANTCVVCHGKNGNSNGPAIPSIAGMSIPYLVDTLEAYKDDSIPSTIMGRLIKGYSSDEILQLAEYFSQQTFVAAKNQTVNKHMLVKGKKLHNHYCKKCHTNEGTAAEDDSGFLKGQWKPYLTAQLMDFRQNNRKASRKMAQKLKKLYRKQGEQGIKAIIEYYGSN